MIKAFYNLYASPEREFAKRVRRITGYIPREIFLYHLALKHSSMVRNKETSAMECNERLEFLGDSVLDTVISEYLFRIYPTRDEGFLTEMRSKIVNRKSLNQICKDLRLDDLIRFNQSRKGYYSKYMYGDALEAFIGAVYMDLGYARVKNFIINRIIADHVDVNDRENRVSNYKSMLLEHVQKEKLDTLSYDLVKETGEGKHKTFQVQVRIGDKVIGKGTGSKKKDAEQKASENALVSLQLLEKQR